jgi:hypothetical protein
MLWKHGCKVNAGTRPARQNPNTTHQYQGQSPAYVLACLLPSFSFLSNFSDLQAGPFAFFLFLLVAA